MLILLLAGTMVASVVLFEKGVMSFNEVVFADGAVSDNMQLLEFLYNKITMVYQYCGEGDFEADRCEFVKSSSKVIEDYLYGLMAIDIEDLVANNTFLGSPYFFYEFVPINMTINQTSTSITSAQFMEYFIHATKKIRSILDTSGKLNSETDFIYKVLRTNFPEMKRINHLNLDLYEQVGKKELKIVAIYEYSMLGASVLLISILVPLIYWFYYSQEEFQKSLLQAYRFIPVKINSELAKYYSRLSEIKHLEKSANINIEPPDMA